MTEKEFDEEFKAVLDRFVAGMAEQADVDVKKFYKMVYFLENLAFFSPVIYGIITEKNDKPPKPSE